MNVKYTKILKNTGGGLHFLQNQLEEGSQVIFSELP